ncbi:rRNA maturation RNase YbeY [Marinoscillum sp. MHG1-6]|uniref:rRNA maturation RNase YbeY n=1 Tax=Marinoscillum sp. MHG1-6 TaxID=2959627 RepID=UPI002158852A|nr:rRNA maturation RNase YbeY [Marinoscillum sp. MHG1-6]
MSDIEFLSEETEFLLENEARIIEWLNTIAKQENSTIGQLTYIFCSDDYLLNINREYLNHDYYTDIITFDNSLDSDAEILGDIFISIDRVTDNASEFNVPIQNELHRVMAHGVLHLLGYGDKTPDEQKVMRQKEEACISLLSD